jgi:hypothetical protein
VAIFLSSVILFPSCLLSSPYYSIVNAVVLTGGPGNDVLTGGFGADSFNCGPGNDIIKDFNKAEGDTTSKNCERSEEPINCKLIVTVIEDLRVKRNVQEKLQSASTNQEPDLVAQIESLNAQISQQEKQLEQCLQTNIDNTPPPEPKPLNLSGLEGPGNLPPKQ